MHAVSHGSVAVVALCSQRVNRSNHKFLTAARKKNNKKTWDTFFISKAVKKSYYGFTLIHHWQDDAVGAFN